MRCSLPDRLRSGLNVKLQHPTSLQDDLIRFGLRAGDAITVHAAVSRVGLRLNGPDALSMAMLDVIGPNSTMLVYTSWDTRDDR